MQSRNLPDNEKARIVFFRPVRSVNLQHIWCKMHDKEIQPVYHTFQKLLLAAPLRLFFFRQFLHNIQAWSHGCCWEGCSHVINQLFDLYLPCDNPQIFYFKDGTKTCYITHLIDLFSAYDKLPSRIAKSATNSVVFFISNKNQSINTENIQRRKRNDHS